MQKAAIIYDFDGTLARGNIQENSFIPSCGLQKDEFWRLCEQRAKAHYMDPILAYMFELCKAAKEHKIDKKTLAEHGKSVRYFSGVEDFFPRVNTRAAELGVRLEHFIISSGTREMIKGTSIAKYFSQIYASSFAYDEHSSPIWPAQAINYTTKTQFIFRINKGIKDINDNRSINAYTPQDEREISFSNMLYIGDGMTDIPSMKLIADKGGTSVAVYAPNAQQSERALVESMLACGRAQYACAADYLPGKAIDLIIENFLSKVSLREKFGKL